MIFVIGNAPQSKLYDQGPSGTRMFRQLLFWLALQKIVQLDIETNVTKWWCDKKIITVQFGNKDGRTQWVVQWSYLTEAEKKQLAEILNGTRILWLIHNAAFECIVFLFHGIRIRNVYDTMLAEMVIHCGEFAQEDDDLEMNETDVAGGYYSLTQVHYRYLASFMDKTEQMNFGDDVLTESKVLYAAGDVKPLWLIRRDQLMKLVSSDLDWVAALEMEAVLGYAEMTYHGMPLDEEKWLANLDLAIPVQAEARRKLDAELIDPKGPFLSKAIKLGFYHPEDRMTINWKSPSQKQELVERFFPPLVGKVGVQTLKRFVSRLESLPEPLQEWVTAFYVEDWTKIEQTMVATDRQWLIDHEYLTPGGAVTINWGAWQQTLPIFQCQQPKLKSTSAKGAGGMGNFFHPIGNAFREWKDSMKLTSTYGQKFIDEHREPDGVVRTTFNQILSTGRVSSRRPNMQQIPVREPIGPRYRNAFVSPAGWTYVSADYVQQELVIIAYLSGEKVWQEALKKRQDLHLVVTEMVFKKEFRDGAEKDCAYFKEDYWSETGQFWASEHPDWASPKWIRQPRKAKCKCKKHKAQREPCKNLSFGMAYGLSKYKFAGDMRWEVKRAEAVIESYFKAFPGLKAMLDFMGNFGLWNGYIMTMEPFFRKRYFPDVEHYSREMIDAHISDVKFDKTLGHIHRASKNMIIQGTAADMAKLSLVMLYWKLHDGPEDLSDRVHLACQVHDQNDTRAREDYADTWAPVLERTMEEAALFIIPNGLLRAERTISPVWTK